MWRQKSWSSSEIGKQKMMALAFVILNAIASVAADESSRAKAVRQLENGVTRQIVVSIPDRRLALVENGKVQKTYDIAVGAEVSPSPEGSFRIVTRLTDPTYYHSGKVIPAGKNNPLGTRWMGLSEKGFGIHGTNQPKSIGRAASHGCIRMAHKDLEELFELIRVGDAVEIRGQRDEFTAAIFGTGPVNTELAQRHSADTQDSRGGQ